MQNGLPTTVRMTIRLFLLRAPLKVGSPQCIHLLYSLKINVWLHMILSS